MEQNARPRIVIREVGDVQTLAERAEELRQLHERVRKTLKGSKISIEPLLPVDVLSVSVVLPQPRV